MASPTCPLAILEPQDQEIEIRVENENPMFIIAGDMNKKDTSCYEEFENVKLINSAPTRGRACIDLCYSDCDVESTSVSIPLWSIDGVDSDHGVVNFVVRFISKVHKYIKIKRRKMTKKGKEKFVKLINEADWSNLLEAAEVDKKVEILHAYIEKSKDVSFPWQTIRIRDDEDPWITEHVRKLIEKRNTEFRRSGRGRDWNELKCKVRTNMESAKQAYYERELEKMYGASNKKGLAFTALKNLNCPYRPKQWSVNDMFPNNSENEAVEYLAEYFSAVTKDYKPLEHDDLPTTYDRPTYQLTSDMIEKRIRESKKPNSTVPGDIPPSLLNDVAKTLSIPLQSIFNAVLPQVTWPTEWKKEYQTIIPKKPNPEAPADLRNLSCTNFFSKILESFVIDSIKSEISMSELQYGGIKGCGTDNFLVEVWNNILETRDNSGNALSLMSVDFSKAFNRLSHSACLRKLAEKCASNQTLALVFAFLKSRSMCVRTNNTTSRERPVNGGSPQGTKLGNLLFCITIDDITDPPEQTSLESPESPITSPISAIPTHHRPRIQSTPAGHNLDDSFEPNPFEFRQKKNVINDTLPYPKFTGGTDTNTWEIGYVDDLNVGETLKLDEGIRHITTSREKREIRAGGSEEMYGHIERNGKDVGMVINAAKTQLLCVHAYPFAEIRSVVSIDGKKIISSDELKILGFKFGTAPTPVAHVNYLKGKFNKSLWSIVHLKRAGMSENVLVKVYISMIRPCLEYGSNVITSMLNENDKYQLESCQRKALRIIYGFDQDYEDMLTRAGIDTLECRRRFLFEKFAVKMSRSERFSKKWLPERNVDDDNMNLRRRKKYVEFRAKGDRLYRLPIFEMRRYLNSIS